MDTSLSLALQMKPLTISHQAPSSLTSHSPTLWERLAKISRKRSVSAKVVPAPTPPAAFAQNPRSTLNRQELEFETNSQLQEQKPQPKVESGSDANFTVEDFVHEKSLSEQKKKSIGTEGKSLSKSRSSRGQRFEVEEKGRSSVAVEEEKGKGSSGRGKRGKTGGIIRSGSAFATSAPESDKERKRRIKKEQQQLTRLQEEKECQREEERAKSLANSPRGRILEWFRQVRNNKWKRMGIDALSFAHNVF